MYPNHFVSVGTVAVSNVSLGKYAGRALGSVSVEGKDLVEALSIGRTSVIVITVALVEYAEVQLMLNKIIEGVFKTAVEGLTVKCDGQHFGLVVIVMFESGHVRCSVWWG